MAGSNIASGFVRKLYLLLDHESPEIIAWNEDGTKFSILDRERLDATVLPKYFRGKLAAFHQQLLDHGFHWESEANDVETYAHASFVRGVPGLLDMIVRTPQPKCKTFPKLKRAKKERRKQLEPYAKKAPPPPSSLQVEPGSHEELVWKAINHFMYSTDKSPLFASAANATLLETPGFTPSMVQLVPDPIPPVVKGVNPLFQTTTTTTNPLFQTTPKNPLFDTAPAKNPLFEKSPSGNPLFDKTPSTNPLFQTSSPSKNPLFQKTSSSTSSNPLFQTSTSSSSSSSSRPAATNPLFAASPLFGAPKPAAAAPASLFATPALFQTTATAGPGNEWQHLVSSSVDRFMQSTDKFSSAEDTFKFIMEERSRIATEKEKLEATPDELFPSLGNAPDALLTFLMGSSVDLLQRSVDTFEHHLTQLDMSDSHDDDDDDDFGLVDDETS